MRQVGILAAAARYALVHHVERLRDDHENAKRFAELLVDAPGVSVDLRAVETNIVNLDTSGSADAIAAKAREHGVLINATGPHRLRAVTHLDVDRAAIELAASRLVAVMKELSA